MANYYYQFNSVKGLVVPDTATVKTDVENEWRSRFGADFDLSASTPQGRLVEMESLSRVGVLGLCALMANQLNIDFATGQALDSVGAFFGVSRNAAVSTRVLATIGGVANTVIPQGSLAKTTAGDVFVLENDCTIPNGGTTTAYFLSQEKGAIPCALGTLTEIVSATLGWETITNSTGATIGEPLESDDSYRQRIQNARYTGISLLESIKGKLQLVDNVKSSFVVDNGTGSAIIYDGITIDAHSLLVIVEGGTDQDVAEAIFNAKSAGCGYTAIAGQSVSQAVVDGAYGVSYTVTFNRPDVLQADVVIDVKANRYSGDDLESDVKQAIVDWATNGTDNVNGLRIGQDLSPFELGAAVSELLPDIYVKSVLVCAHEGTPAASELTCTIAEKLAISVENITVNVV